MGSAMRWLELACVVVVAIVLLLPAPRLTAVRALKTDAQQFSRIALLEDRLVQSEKHDAAAAELRYDLADAYFQAGHPDWALQTTADQIPSPDYRVHRMRGAALAELLLPARAITELDAALAVCTSAPKRCPADERTRIEVLRNTMAVLADRNLDPRKTPDQAKQAVLEALRHIKPIQKSQEKSNK